MFLECLLYCFYAAVPVAVLVVAWNIVKQVGILQFFQFFQRFIDVQTFAVGVDNIAALQYQNKV